MLDVRLIERGLEKPGKTKGGLAAAMGVRPGAVSEILSGLRLIKASEIPNIIDYLDLNSVPIMGRVGAGAAIEPEHEQVPPEGLGEIELPVGVLFGTADRVLDHRLHGLPLKDEIAGIDLELVEGVGHMPHYAAVGTAAAFVRKIARRAFGSA